MLKPERLNSDRSHQQNLSINSIASLVEPVTPPDEHHQFTTSAPSTVLSYPHNSNNHPVAPGSGSGSGSATYKTHNQPLGMSSSIGGNTMRSRFKSLPLVTELDKFNSNISSLQSLSSAVSSGSNSSNGSSNIPQISLQQYQRFNSMPSLTSTPSSSVTSIQSVGSSNNKENFKNYDELNLIPIEQLDILKLSTDQYGCRYLQKKLEIDSSIKDIIFNKIFNNLIDLIVDPFGNYLIQKLVDYLTTYQKDLLIEKIHSCLFLIAINQYGTRSLQKIIDKITNTYQMDLVIKGLQINDTTITNTNPNNNNPIEDNNIVKLIKDLNGNHVIQKCIFKFPPPKFQFIIDSICLNNNIVKISTHKHGCCVLQKLLNNADFNQILKISQVLLIYLDDLINDQFGNYIIQFLFELNFLKIEDSINFLIDEFFKKIYKNLIQLSCLKFSSNVIEKFIKILKHKKNYIYLNEIIKLINLNFEILIKDKFGNYVIQTLIDQFYDIPELNFEMNLLINTVKNYLPVIKSAPYARKIQLKIQQLENNYTLNQSNSNSNSNSSNSNSINSINSNSFNGNYQTGFDQNITNFQNYQQMIPQYQNQNQQNHQQQQIHYNNVNHNNVYNNNFNPYYQEQQFLQNSQQFQSQQLQLQLQFQSQSNSNSNSNSQSQQFNGFIQSNIPNTIQNYNSFATTTTTNYN